VHLKICPSAAGDKAQNIAATTITFMGPSVPTIEQQIVVWEKDDESAKALSNVTDAQVRRMLAAMADEIQHYDRA
jgi:hypothetical protein